MNVAAFDPGVTTGYAQGIIDNGLMTVVTGQEHWAPKELYNFLVEHKIEVAISERFEFRHGKRSSPHGVNLFPRELIGVVKLYTEMSDTKLVMQNPMKDNPTTYYNNARLKQDGIYKSGQTHANDAARHLLYWFKFGAGFQFNTKGYKPGVLA